MRGIDNTSIRFVVAATGLAVIAAGCGRQASAVSAAQPATPMVITCQPNEQALIRPVQMNGTMVSQVECMPAGYTAPADAAYQAPPPPAGYPAYATPARAPYANPEIVQTSYPVRASEPREAPRRRAAPRDSTRTWKKSAVIVGSSAGVGAGVGAAIGGKKGALIGAAIGGGGAAIWDQVTRRK